MIVQCREYVDRIHDVRNAYTILVRNNFVFKKIKLFYKKIKQ